MSSAPSVPGVEGAAPWLGGCEQVLTAGRSSCWHSCAGRPGQAARICPSRARSLTFRLPRSPLRGSTGYQAGRHLAHEQGLGDQPRRLRCGIPGVELRELTETKICCGSAGSCNLLHPEPARELAERKATAALATGAQLIVTANPGCWMQVAATLARLGERWPAAHVMQVLNASIQGRPAGLAQHQDGSTR